MIGIGVGIGVNSYVAGGTVPPLPPLLDSYSVAVSYDLRKTRTAYTGNCIRVRRSGDNAEQNIGFVNNNLDTTALMSFTGTNSAYVTTWYDQSGNARHLTQTTSTQQPRIVNSGVLETKNSKPAIYFDGTNDILLNASHPTAIQDGNAHSYFVVGSNEASSAASRVVSSYYLSSEWYVVIDRSTNKLNFTIANSSGTAYKANMASQVNSGNYRLLSGFVTTGKVMSGYYNGSGGVGDTYVSPYTLGSFSVGARNDNATPLKGYVGCVIILSGDESANRTTIENNINTFYSIY